MLISDWSSDVCSSDLELVVAVRGEAVADALVDGDAKAAERGDLLGIIGQQAHPAEAEVVEHLGGRQVDPLVGIEAELLVGVQGVGAAVLQGDRKSTRLNSSH